MFLASPKEMDPNKDFCNGHILLLVRNHLSVLKSAHYP